MTSDTPWWDNLQQITVQARYLKLIVIATAAILSALLATLEIRKQILESHRDGTRRVPAKLISELKVWLQPHQGTEIQITPIADDQEAALFRKELCELFASAGWVVNKGGTGQIPVNTSWGQIELLYYSLEPVETKAAAVAASRVLKRLGFNYRVTPVTGRNFNPGTMLIQIGLR